MAPLAPLSILSRRPEDKYSMLANVGEHDGKPATMHRFHWRLEGYTYTNHTRLFRGEKDALDDEKRAAGDDVETYSKTWLWVLHTICFCIHLTWMIFTILASSGDMKVELTRLKPNWENQGGEYSYRVVPLDADEQIFRIDVVTALFFGLSAGMHSIWVFIGPWECSKPFLWNKLDECLCWWRWLEYSVSASVMILGIAVICAVRDKYTLVSIFALTCTTMFCGLATEMYSRPALLVDKYGRVTDKYNMQLWEGQQVARVQPSEVEPSAAPEFVDGRRVRNYLYRMTPHIFGIFPYGFAWFPIVDSFFQQIDDLCDRLENLMPDWVPLIIVGCFAIFSCFTFVQWRYQWTAPKHYWRTEVWYCFLSATSKSFLGFTLYINVISKASFNEATAVVDRNVTTSFNETAFCLYLENFTSMRS